MKSVVMVGGSVQLIQAVKVAQSMGFYVIVTDRNPEAPCFEVADQCVIIDGRDVEGLAAYVMSNKDKYGIKGVFTLTEMVTSVAVIAEAAGLPGVPIASAVACQNKALSK
ncbi:MAG: ATPase, partial [Dehalococcoidia bacterium]|nr:ATPase [Dehalococcoidia bacterium]